VLLDYSRPSLVAHDWVRDEIREIAPGVYLGLVFWGPAVMSWNFALDFTRPD